MLKKQNIEITYEIFLKIRKIFSESFIFVRVEALL